MKKIYKIVAYIFIINIIFASVAFFVDTIFKLTK